MSELILKPGPVLLWRKWEYDEVTEEGGYVDLDITTAAHEGCVAISGSGKVWYGRFSQKPHQKYPLQGS